MDKCVFPEKKKTHTKGLKLLLKWVQSDQTQALFALSFNAICYKDKQLLTSSTISPGLPTLLPHNKHMELVGKVWTLKQSPSSRASRLATKHDLPWEGMLSVNYWKAVRAVWGMWDKSPSIPVKWSRSSVIQEGLRSRTNTETQQLPDKVKHKRTLQGSTFQPRVSALGYGFNCTFK